MIYFELYAVAIVLSMFAASQLASLGIHAVARGESLAGLLISQAAALGVLLGHFLFENISHGLEVVGPLFSVAVTMFYLRIISHAAAGKEALLLAATLTFQTLTMLIVFAFPSLDAKFKQVFFGDLVTILNWQYWILGIPLVAIMGLYLRFRERLLDHTFNRAVLKRNDRGTGSWVYRLSFVGLITLSTYLLGQLFTLGFLVVPATFLGFRARHSQKLHQILVALIGLIAVPLGFSISLTGARISTSACIVLTAILLSLVFRFGVSAFISKAR